MASDKEWVKISELSEEEKQSLTAGTAVLLHDNYYNGSSEKASLIRKKGSQGRLEDKYYELKGQMVRILFGSRSLKSLLLYYLFQLQSTGNRKSN